MQKKPSSRPTRPKSIFEIWWRVLPSLKNRYPNNLISASGALVGLIPLFFGTSENFSSSILIITDILTGAYISLIGFIATGFAIFTATDSSFLVAISKFPVSISYNDKKLSLLELHLFNFVKLLIYVGVGTILVLSISVVGRILSLHPGSTECWQKLFQMSTLMLVGISITVVSVQVKSLVFNLYDLTFVRVEHIKKYNSSEKRRR